MGCGPGTITADLALLVAPGDMVGIDTAADVVAQARSTPSGLGVENLRFEVADLFALGFPDASFDVIHLHQVLQRLQDPVAALVELRRVLDPDGLLAARDRTSEPSPGPRRIRSWTAGSSCTSRSRSATVTTPASVPDCSAMPMQPDSPT